MPENIKFQTVTNSKLMVLYFAYGSNMSKEVLEGRRKIYPTHNINAVAAGYTLSFNVPGLPFYEPSFASILPKKNGKVHGVVYTITEKEFQRVIRTEGGHGVKYLGYTVIDIPVMTYTGEKLIAKTLYYNCSIFPNTIDYLPSKRYLNLIINGARQHKLNNSYINSLEDKEWYDSKGTISLFFKCIFTLFLLPLGFLLLTFYIFMKYFKIRLGLVLGMATLLLKIIYSFHNTVWILVFPSGLNNKKM